MCGLIYGHRKDKMPIGKTVFKRYQKQRERGHEGFGFITIDKGQISGIHRFEKESDAVDALKESKSSTILFHHRLPTSTPNHKDMTHPIAVINKKLKNDYYVIHNGVLRNEHTLKYDHEKMGFEYTTIFKEITAIETRSGKSETSKEKFNDSEALAIEVALFLDGKKKTIDAVGTIAFIAVETDKKGNVLNIHYGRNNGNPLVVEDNNDIFFLKSTGDGDKVGGGEIMTMNFQTEETTFQKVPVGKIYEPAPEHGKQRSIGFGANDRDEYDNDPRDAGTGMRADGSMLSPALFLPESHRSRHPVINTTARGRDFSGLPFASADSTEMYESIDWQDRFEQYRLTDEYILDLWAEIEALENDIEKCKLLLDGTHILTSEDYVYNEEYLDECEHAIESKRSEAKELEAILKRREAARNN